MTGDRRTQDRRSGDPRVNELVDKLALVEQRQCDLAKQHTFNTEITAAVNKNTADIIKVWQACQGGLKVLGWIGTAVKWLTAIALGVSATLAVVQAWLHFGGGK